MRRSGHPSRPRAITCCFFASFKTLLISTKATCLTPKSTSRASFSLAGFQVTLIGRFWVTPEAYHLSPRGAEGSTIVVPFLKPGSGAYFFRVKGTAFYDKGRSSAKFDSTPTSDSDIKIDQ